MRRSRSVRKALARRVLVAAALTAPCVPAFAQATWVNRTPVAYPSDADIMELAFDSNRGFIVAFEAGQTWEFDGDLWTRRFPATSPPERRLSQLAYDSARGVTVLYRGYGDGGPLDDMWEWDGTNWTERTPGP